MKRVSLQIFNSIAVRISLTIAFAVLLTAIAVTWIILQQERNILEMELRQKGIYLAELIAQHLVEPLLYEERHMMHSILQASLSIERGIVVFAGVYDAKGNTIIPHDEASLIDDTQSRIQDMQQHYDVKEDNDRQLYDILMAIEAKGLGTIGFLRLGITKKFLIETITQVKQKLYLVVSGIIFAGIMAGLLIARKLISPILFLNQGVKRVASGELGVEIDVRGIGEIRELAVAFNEMSKKLKDSVEAMKTAHENLIRKERLYALGEFSAGLAHEIKNPLTSIKMLMQSAKESGIQLSPKDIEVIEGEINRIDRIVREFLLFAKPAKTVFVDTDINEILQEVIALSRRNTQKANITVVEDLEPGLSPIKAHPDGIKQVFLNIILNSIQAMQQGGILTISSYSENGVVYACFKDTGEGIPEEISKRIFDPFFTTKENGTGMGLYIAYNIVREHGGSIEISSEINKGTAVCISLPRHN